MKKNLTSLALLSILIAQAQENDTIKSYRKPIIQGVETDFLLSYYTQDGIHAAVLGGRGTEELEDITPTVIVNIPHKLDNVWTIDAGIDSYTSASSSKIDIDDNTNIWEESSGASQADIRGHADVTFAHHAKNRNKIWSVGVGFSTEFDVTSFNIAGSYTKLFNEKATEIGVKGQVFFDSWKLILPAEFKNNQNFIPLEDDTRQTYALSLTASQIVNSKFQMAVTTDIVYQQGLLSTPFNRVYDNQIFLPSDILFEPADDIERLPNTRLKIPLGLRANYYLNDWISLRSYYRFYWDDWGIKAHTASLEVPIKFNSTFTLYPMYRYHTQSEADYFAPYAMVDLTDEFYTSDYDLSKFTAHQYGVGFRIAPALGIFKYKVPFVGNATRRMKSIDIRYNHYQREDGLKANIVSLALSFGL